MSKEVVDHAVALLRLAGAPHQDIGEAQPARAPLPGAVGWPDDDDRDAVAAKIREAGPADGATARLLVDTYGMRGVDVAKRMAADPTAAERLVEGRPERMAQVDFAVEEELAQTVRDVMIRRTQLYFRDHDQGLGAADKVADRMAKLLLWSEERRTSEVLAYQAEVARSRAWRAG